MANRYPLILTTAAGGDAANTFSELKSIDDLRLDGTTLGTGASQTHNPIRVAGTTAGSAYPIIKDASGATVISSNYTVSAVNHFVWKTAVTGGKPYISVDGDTNVTLQLRPKAGGVIEVGDSASTGILAASHDGITGRALSLRSGASTSGQILISPGANAEITINPNGNGVTRVRGGTGGFIVDQASTQDAVKLLGRAGGTTSLSVTLTPTTLTADRTLTLPDVSGTVATTGNLSQFAATTSAQLAGVISDETGTGSLVFANTPTFTTPVLGAATATSLRTGTGGIGYAGTGSGGTVTQATSRVTGVTLNTICGTITLFSTTTTANTTTTFTVTNSTVAAGDRIIFNHVSGGVLGAYNITAATAAGSFTCSVYTSVAQATAAAPVIGFAVIKATTA